MKISIRPGSMDVAKNAIDLFGLNRVDAGTWGSPVCVRDLTQEEADFAVEYFDEKKVEVIGGDCS